MHAVHQSRDLFSMQYVATYYFANIIDNLVQEKEDHPKVFDRFFRPESVSLLVRPFPRYTTLHHFIYLCIELDLVEFGFDENILPHELKYNPYFSDVDHNFRSIEQFRKHFRPFADDVFFILFLNRQLLSSFHEVIAEHIAEIPLKSLKRLDRVRFRKDGVLCRVSMPVWAKRAVFYRERGRCALCGKNVSGLQSIYSREHYDHIAPLARGGLNDVTNLQLLCKECNLNKNASKKRTSSFYERWF